MGFVVHLNYENPHLSPFDEFQRFKTHPAIRGMFEGGKRLAYGARAINEGGLQSVPKLSFPGGALIGCAAGFVNLPRIKGSHNAMKTGMLGAEAAFAAVTAGRHHDELTSYPEAFRQSWVYEDLYKVRNVKPGLSWGMWAGTLHGGVHMWLNDLGLGALVPWTLRHDKPDHASLKSAAEMPKIDYPKYDGVLTFDKLSSVFVSNTSHEENQPSHLQLQGRHDSGDDQSRALRRPRAALLSRRRLRVRRQRRRFRQAAADQRGELRPLQDVRHQGSAAEHPLGDARGRRRSQLSEHVGAARVRLVPPFLRCSRMTIGDQMNSVCSSSGSLSWIVYVSLRERTERVSWAQGRAPARPASSSAATDSSRSPKGRAPRKRGVLGDLRV